MSDRCPVCGSAGHFATCDIAKDRDLREREEHEMRMNVYRQLIQYLKYRSPRSPRR